MAFKDSSILMLLDDRHHATLKSGPQDVLLKVQFEDSMTKQCRPFFGSKCRNGQIAKFARQRTKKVLKFGHLG